MLGIINADDLTNIFQSKIEFLVDKHFPIKTRSVKSTDDPWITDWIRALIRRRKKEYRKNERSLRWKKLKLMCDTEIRLSKSRYYDKECKKMTTPGAHRVAFHALKNLNKARRQKPWSIMELYPEKSKNEVLEILADYYNRISVEFPALDITDKHNTYERELRELSLIHI